MYAQERLRAENHLLAAQQNVVAMTAQLRMANEKLTTMEDLIGEVRTRMYKRGLATHPIILRGRQKSGSLPSINNESATGLPPGKCFKCSSHGETYTFSASNPRNEAD